MKFKGTSGKWDLFQDYDHAYSQKVLNISNWTDGCMATIWTGKDRDEEIPEEIKSNALLISKAPEMLEMLKDVFELLNPVTDEQGVKESYYQLMPKIEQLIKEATEL